MTQPTSIIVPVLKTKLQPGSLAIVDSTKISRIRLNLCKIANDMMCLSAGHTVAHDTFVFVLAVSPTLKNKLKGEYRFLLTSEKTLGWVHVHFLKEV